MKKYIVIIIIFAATIAISCNKGLDLIPKDTISDATFWKTPADFKLAANNLYISLEGFNTEDVQTDLAYNVPNSVSNGTWQPAETDGNWSTPYVYIRHCNNIIEKAAASSIAGQVKQIVAEAKFFRAYNYWRLFRLYGGVPLITKVLDITDQDVFGARATRQETVELILKDLTEAVVDLPEKKSLANVDIGRITKGAAISLKARVALFEGTWGKFRNDANAMTYLDTAINAATAVMNSGQYSLFTGKGSQSYRYLFIDEGDDASETILDRRHQINISGHNFTYDVGTGILLPTKKLADMYLSIDGLPIHKSSLFQGYNRNVSEYQDRDPRMSMTMLIPGTPAAQEWYPVPVPSWPFYPQRNANTGYTTYKFLSEDAFANEVIASRYNFDHHIIRYAEILLIYAEATFEKNGNLSDGDLNKSINLIRKRAGLNVDLTNVFVAANSLDMREEIRRERTIELALESFRYDDLRRWKIAEIELPKDIKGVKIVGTQWVDPVVIEGANRNPYAAASWQSKTDAQGFIIAERVSGRFFNPAKDYLRYIPTKEILLNPDLKQNPGW